MRDRWWYKFWDPDEKGEKWCGVEEEERGAKGEKEGLGESPVLSQAGLAGVFLTLHLTVDMQQVRRYFVRTLPSNNALVSRSTSFPRTSEGVTNLAFLWYLSFPYQGKETEAKIWASRNPGIIISRLWSMDIFSIKHLSLLRQEAVTVCFQSGFREFAEWHCQ